MDEKIAKLKAAVEEAASNVAVCKEALDLASRNLAMAKNKYKDEKYKDVPVNDTELPELIETQIRAKNVYETAQTRHATNVRYLAMMEEKRDKAK